LISVLSSAAKAAHFRAIDPSDVIMDMSGNGNHLVRGHTKV